MIYSDISVSANSQHAFPLVPSGQSEAVFASMAGDFMKPVVNIIDELLAAGVNVTVYNGQLDLIVDTVGKNCQA